MSRELANYSSSGSVVVKRSPSVSKTVSSRKVSANGKYVPSKTLRKTLSGMNSSVNSLNELLSKSKSIQGKSGIVRSRDFDK